MVAKLPEILRDLLDCTPAVGGQQAFYIFSNKNFWLFRFNSPDKLLVKIAAVSFKSAALIDHGEVLAWETAGDDIRVWHLIEVNINNTALDNMRAEVFCVRLAR